MKGETMKEQSDSELYAELNALRQRLSHLEAAQEKGGRPTACVQRPTFLRKCLLGPLPLAVFVLGGGLLYAQGDALFIDSKGNVGIGTTTPEATLDVTGTSRLGRGVAESWFPYTDNNAYISGKQTIIRSDNSQEFVRINPTGNVGIGVTDPAARLDVAGTSRLGRGIAESWFPYSDNNAYISGNQTIIRSDGSGGYQEFVRINPKGNVGIGTTSPSEKLHVAGTVKIEKDLQVTQTAKVSGSYVPGGIENLQMLRGVVNLHGTTIAGSGFTSKQTEIGGVYDILFETPFRSQPAGSVTQVFDGGGGTGGSTLDNANIVQLTTKLMRVKMGNSKGDASYRDFTFIVLGPR
jgi:hypothetical protein